MTKEDFTVAVLSKLAAMNYDISDERLQESIEKYFEKYSISYTVCSLAIHLKLRQASTLESTKVVKKVYTCGVCRDFLTQYPGAQAGTLILTCPTCQEVIVSLRATKEKFTTLYDNFSELVESYNNILNENLELKHGPLTEPR